MARFRIINVSRQLVGVLVVLVWWTPPHPGLRRVSGATQEDQQQCTNTFHVWQPGQDAQNMLREIYLKMDNVTSFSHLQVSELRAHLSEEVSRINKWTFAVDKRMLQMQVNKLDEELVQMKEEAGLAKIQTDIDHTGRRVDDLESSLYTIRSKLRGGVWSHSALQQDQDRSPQRMDKDEHVTGVLQNSISDLKAEWLVLKRDVEGMKKADKRQKKQLQLLTNARISIQTLLDQTTTVNKGIQTSNTQLQKTQGFLQQRMTSLIKETSKIHHLIEEFKEGIQEQRGKLESVHSLSESLEGRLSHLEQQQQPLGPLADGTDTRTVGPESSKEKHNHSVKEDRKSASMGEFDLSPDFAKDCHDIYRSGFRVSGVYPIKPDGMNYSLPVYCFIINGTGYTLIQRRQDGTINFNRRWMEYSHGFGNPYGEIWMGNEFIHHVTKRKRYILRVDMWDWEGGQYFAEYKTFRVDGASENYRLHVGNYTGNAGDSMSYHDNMAFSTEDADNDLHQRSCGAENKAGWWFNSCYLCQLNGLYHTGWYSGSQSNFADGIVWYTLKGDDFYSLRKVEMNLRPLEM